MLPEKGHKLTSGGEIFFFAGTAKSCAQGLLSRRLELISAIAVLSATIIARAAIMEAPVAQTKNSKLWQNLPGLGIFSRNLFFCSPHAAAPPCKKVAFFVQKRGFMPAQASRESVLGYEPALSAPSQSAAQCAGPVGDKAPGA